MKTEFSIFLFGPMTAWDADGRQVSIPSERGRALLGILALAPLNEKDRRLLQDLLWPDRSLSQAQGSLRQEVARIRRAFGDPSVILANGTQLKLNSDLVTINLDRGNMNGALAPEFLEGVDIAGPFEDWVRDARRYLNEVPTHKVVRAEALPAERGVSLHFAGESKSVVGDIFLDRIARSISDISYINIERGDDPAKASINLTQKISQTEQAMVMRHAISTGPSKEIKWTSEWSGTETDVMAPDLLREGFQAQQAVLEALTQLSTTQQAELIGIQAMQDAFSLDRHRVKHADAAFQQAYKIAPHPAFLAWRAFLMTNQIIERQCSNVESTADNAVSLVWQALQDAPDNAAVLAIASHVLRVLDDKPEMAAEFGQDALRLNPTNPLAWSSAANSLITLGFASKALPMAERALAIARNSPLRFWWEMNACVAAVVNGNSARGLFHAELAHRLKPEFRPPLRYLTALHLAEQNAAPAIDAAQKLQLLEPDFEIRLFHEPDYPAATLRQSSIYERMRAFEPPDLNEH